MKKVLTLVLTLALLLVPMAVIAEEGDAPVAVPVEGHDNVTIEVTAEEADGGGGFGHEVLYTPEKSGTITITASAEDKQVALFFMGASEDDYEFYPGATAELGATNEITCTERVKAGCSYVLYFYGGKSDSSGKVTYTIAFAEGEEEKEVTSWDAPKVIKNYTASVTIPAGETMHISYEDYDAYSPYYEVSIEGVEGFTLIQASDPVYDEETGSFKYTETEYKDVEGLASFESEEGFFGISALFAIKNNTDSEFTYYITIKGAEGTISNPLPLEVGETTVEAPYSGYFYTFTVANAGVLHITMTSEEWGYYVLTPESTGDPDYHFNTDENPCATTDIEVDQHDIITLWVCDKISFKVVLEQDYAVDNKQPLVLGENKVTPLPDTGTTIFGFAPEQDGIYKFETAEGLLIGYWGGNEFYLNDQTENKTNTLEHEFKSVGTTAYVGVKTDKPYTIKVTRIGDRKLTESDFPVIQYKNESTPEAFEWDGTWTFVNVVSDKVKDIAVLGADGYYHLNKADGPILYVELTSSKFVDLVDANNWGALKYTIQLGEQKWERGNYKELFTAYQEAGSTVALTKELMDMFQKVGKSQGWYDKDAANYLFTGVEVDPEEAWMFACKYVKLSEEEVPEIKLDNVSGDANTYDRGQNKDVVITIDADIDSFKGLYLNGKLVPKDCYDVKAGSIIITLKASYVSSLENGENTFAVVYNNGNVSNVTIQVTGEIEGTGDVSSVVYVVMLLGAAVTAVGFTAKKRFA